MKPRTSTTETVLTLMRSKRDLTKTRLRVLHHQLTAQAESATRSERDLPNTFGRSATDWSKRHEAYYQQRLSELTTAHRNDIGALEAKLKRQNAAITEHHIRAFRRNEAIA